MIQNVSHDLIVLISSFIFFQKLKRSLSFF